MFSTGGNKKVDNLIQEMQLKIRDRDDIVFEWIPYDQFDIKEINKGDFVTVYSAIWKDGPLLNKKKRHWMRVPNKKVTLECLSNSQNNIDWFLKGV